MTMIRNVIKALVSSETFASMESESRSWMVQCPHCKYERSIWEMGGVRWGAAGSPKTYKLCSNCTRLGWHVIYRKS